jgi:hypothetical protein
MVARHRTGESKHRPYDFRLWTMVSQKSIHGIGKLRELRDIVPFY